MAFQYLGQFAKLIAPYGNGTILLSLIDTRHGEIKTDIGNHTPLTDYSYVQGFSDIESSFPDALSQRIIEFASKLVVDEEDIVWLIVSDTLAQRPYVRPDAYIKKGYDGTVFGSQATMKPDNSRDFTRDQIHGIPATLDTLRERGLF